MGKHVAVTGGGGRLGNTLVRRLLESGSSVRVLDLDPHGVSLAGLDIERVRGSVLDAGALDELLEGARALFHCAAKVDLRADRDGRIFRVNVAGTRLVADACVKRSIRMVHTSSHAALDRAPLSMPLTEANRLALEDPCDYHRSKAHAERVVLERVASRALDAVIVNPGTLTGPHDFEPSMFGAAMIDLRAGKIPILLDALTDYCDVRDVADATIAALEKGRSGERYLLTGEVLDIREIARIVEKLTGRRMPKRALPLWVGWALLPATMAVSRVRGVDPRYSAGMLRASVSNRTVSHEKAARELGYAPRSMDASLADAFAFYEQHGFIAR